MKTALFISVLVTNLVIAGSSFALSHGGVDGESLQPTLPSKLFIVSPEFAGKEKLEILQQKLNDPDPFVRVDAVQALGEIQKEKALISVCDCLNDENIYVRAYAAEALGKIGQLDVTLVLSRLLPALNDTAPYVRAMILVALGELQDARAADAIIKFLHDEDESVRTMAAWALKKLENAQ